MPVAPNLLDGNLSPPEPNQAWTSEGWLYLAVVIDRFNREVEGGSIKPRKTMESVMDALRMAWLRRKPAQGLLHHSDRGSHEPLGLSRISFGNTVGCARCAARETAGITLPRSVGSATSGMSGSMVRRLWIKKRCERLLSYTSRFSIIGKEDSRHCAINPRSSISANGRRIRIQETGRLNNRPCWSKRGGKLKRQRHQLIERTASTI